jgi:hypothetical protein
MAEIGYDKMELSVRKAGCAVVAISFIFAGILAVVQYAISHPTPTTAPIRREEIGIAKPIVETKP